MRNFRGAKGDYCRLSASYLKNAGPDILVRFAFDATTLRRFDAIL